MGDIIFEVGRYTFESAYGHRFFFYSSTSAGWLAWSVTGTSQYSREYIGLPIDHVRFGVFSGGDESNVLRYRRVCRTRVLAIHYLVVVLRVFIICRLHDFALIILM
jgi:hypothetical protein